MDGGIKALNLTPAVQPPQPSYWKDQQPRPQVLTICILRREKSFCKIFREVFRSFCEVFQSFRKFFEVFASFSRLSDPFGPIGMHSDAFGSNWKRLDVFEKCWDFFYFWVVFQRFRTYFLQKTFFTAHHRISLANQSFNRSIVRSTDCSTNHSII